jgi:hypothetical protein
MRQVANAERIELFMRELGAEARVDTKLYFTGGATAVLLGWRETTIDVDMRFLPETDRLYRAIPSLKERLQINVELASPADFIPEVPGWQDRSLYIRREGKMSFYHYDLYAQALAKAERHHTQDLLDVQEMINRAHIEPRKALEYLSLIEPNLYKYPAIDPSTFRRYAEELFGKGGD